MRGLLMVRLEMRLPTSNAHQTWHAALKLSSDSRPSVLVVDDEHIVADTLAAILKNNGFASRPVYRGESAIEIARQLPLDAVVCDILLGGENGIDIVRQIREIRPDCKIILISGASESAELLEEASTSGQYFEVLAKPFQPDTLINKLREMLGLATEAA